MPVSDLVEGVNNQCRINKAKNGLAVKDAAHRLLGSSQVTIDQPFSD
jgi:hypothetical protein